jgi:hypothetical protein
MNRAQRFVLVLYSLLLAYCCLWIPWYVPVGLHERHNRLGYAWLWAGAPATRSAPIVHNPPVDAGNGYQIVGEEDAVPTPHPTAVPDYSLMGVECLALTAVSLAAFLIAGMWKSATLS